MADLLSSGATMLPDQCPECNGPLFRINGEVWCPRDNKRVMIVKEGDEARTDTTLSLAEVERTLLIKIQESNLAIREERDPATLERLSSLLNKWLEALERVRAVQKQ